MLYLKSVIIKFIDLLLLFLKRFVVILFRSQYLRHQNTANVINNKLEELMNFKEMVQSKGFEVEEHKVTTNDGYILKLYRISYESDNLKSEKSLKN